MESGLEGRNNVTTQQSICAAETRLNGVRPRRPEQCCKLGSVPSNADGLNGVRPRRPEQFVEPANLRALGPKVSMESGLEGRNNPSNAFLVTALQNVSMESGLEGRNNARP